MYNRYFGFREAPFSITPDPRFFYANPMYVEAYANLRYGIEGKKGFIAITGEVGTGKTTLLRKLMHGFQDAVRSAFVFNTDLTFNELLRVTLQDLGLTPQGMDKLAMIEELNAYLIDQLKKGGIVCLLIDEAQNLSDESLEGLRLLSNLETDREKLLQIVLMGQPELNAKLDQPNLRQLKQRIAIQCEIAPLEPEEIGSYIQFRLRAAGCEDQQLFDPDAVQKIAAYSQGIPRVINTLCDNALLVAYAASQKTVTAAMISAVARDLRIGSAAERSKTGSFAVYEGTNQVAQHPLGRMIRGGVATVLVIFIFIAFASISDLHFFPARTLEPLTPQPNQDIRPAGRPNAIAPQVTAKAETTEQGNREVEFDPGDRQLIIPYGSTISEIARKAYGTKAVLGMDLIKEFNPQITNLNWVSAGQVLFLPGLTRGTLVRQQPGGSYRVIIASFLTQREADEFAQRIGKPGGQIIIAPRRVANDLLLHRLEIGGLRNLEEATRILENGLRNEWLTLSSESGNWSQRTMENPNQ